MVLENLLGTVFGETLWAHPDRGRAGTSFPTSKKSYQRTSSVGTRRWPSPQTSCYQDSPTGTFCSEGGKVIALNRTVEWPPSSPDSTRIRLVLMGMFNLPNFKFISPHSARGWQFTISNCNGQAGGGRHAPPLRTGQAHMWKELVNKVLYPERIKSSAERNPVLLLFFQIILLKFPQV